MRIAMSGLVILFWALPASAWEADVHYGLTKWLAIRVGFTPADAEWIAAGNLRSDSGVLDATHLVPRYTCFGGRDIEAAMLARDRHFPTLDSLPAPPDQRQVVAGGPAATLPVNEIALTRRDTMQSDLERQWILTRFGAALHALQDSWSHQGTPDPPDVVCNKNLAWAHPEKRKAPKDLDGWWSHQADLTPAWDTDTEAMALATYKALKSFRANSPGWPWPNTPDMPEPWPTLKPRVKAFQASTTKAWKRKWFTCEGFAKSELDFLLRINLRNGSDRSNSPCLAAANAVAEPIPTPRSPLDPSPAAPSASSPTPLAVLTDARRFLEAFLRAWMVDHGEDAKLLTEFVNPTAMAAAMARARKQAAARPTDERASALAQLSMWRIKDHGLVEQLSHGQSSHQQWEAALHTAGALGQDPAFRVDYKSLDEATYEVTGCKDRFVLIENPDRKNEHIALTRFKHAPDDTIVITIARDSATGRWQVQSVTSVVEHD